MGSPEGGSDIQLKQRIRLALEAADEKKATDPVAINLKGVASFTDCFVICTGNLRRQNQAICDAIVEQLRDIGERPWHVEGYERGEWIMIDYSDLVAHIFTPDAREFYNLERLWGDAPRVAMARPRTPRKKGASAGRKG